MTFTRETKYDVPAGFYDVEFVGVEERGPFSRDDRFGPADPTEPRLVGQFKVLSGELAGKVIEQEIARKK
jgi:hypothetical protein